GEPLRAPLRGGRRAHAVDGECGFVVEPDDGLAVPVAAGLGLEATRRRGAVLWPQAAGLCTLADIRGRAVAGCESEQRDRRAREPPVAMEQHERGATLVDDGEGRATVVTRFEHALCKLPGGGRDARRWLLRPRR